MTFKVGDRVRVKTLDDSWTSRVRGILSGALGTIVEHKPTNYLGKLRESPYQVKFADKTSGSEAWWFTESELEPYVPALLRETSGTVDAYLDLPAVPVPGGVGKIVITHGPPAADDPRPIFECARRTPASKCIECGAVWWPGGDVPQCPTCGGLTELRGL